MTDSNTSTALRPIDPKMAKDLLDLGKLTERGANLVISQPRNVYDQFESGDIKIEDIIAFLSNTGIDHITTGGRLPITVTSRVFELREAAKRPEAYKGLPSNSFVLPDSQNAKKLKEIFKAKEKEAHARLLDAHEAFKNELLASGHAERPTSVREIKEFADTLDAAETALIVAADFVVSSYRNYNDISRQRLEIGKPIQPLPQRVRFSTIPANEMSREKAEKLAGEHKASLSTVRRALAAYEAMPADDPERERVFEALKGKLAQAYARSPEGLKKGVSTLSNASIFEEDNDDLQIAFEADPTLQTAAQWIASLVRQVEVGEDTGNAVAARQASSALAHIETRLPGNRSKILIETKQILAEDTWCGAERDALIQDTLTTLQEGAWAQLANRPPTAATPTP